MSTNPREQRALGDYEMLKTDIDLLKDKQTALISKLARDLPDEDETAETHQQNIKKIDECIQEYDKLIVKIPHKGFLSPLLPTDWERQGINCIGENRIRGYR